MQSDIRRAIEVLCNPGTVYSADRITSRRRDGAMSAMTKVELRGRGGQTIVPPSVHPSGERVAWEEYGEPAHVAAVQLRRAVATVAAGAMLARRWPTGARHEAALALAGLLLRGGMPLHDAGAVQR